MTKNSLKGESLSFCLISAQLYAIFHFFFDRLGAEIFTGAVERYPE